MNSRKKYIAYLSVYSAFLFVVFFGAYAGIIPTEMKFIPFYDSIGHFVLYGTWAYLLGRVFEKPLDFKLGSISAGVAFVVIFATLEEFLQSYSSVRTFSLFDLWWGLLGITLTHFLLTKKYK